MTRLPKRKKNEIWLRGRRVAGARIEALLSQQDLADRTGLTRSIISDIECGDRDMYVGELEAIAKALQKDIRYFSTEEIERLSNDRQS